MSLPPDFATLLSIGPSASEIGEADPTSVVILTDIAAVIRGEKGEPGVAVEHVQLSPSDTWVCNHNLGYRPNVGVFSVGGVEMFACVIQASVNQVLVYFDSPTTGFAVFS